MAKPGKSAREKGLRFERTVKAILEELGGDVRRVLLSGINGEGDIEGLDLFHIECKFHEQTRLYEWLGKELPKARKNQKLLALIHKLSRRPILVTMPIEDWVALIKYIYNLRRRLDENV